jgi:hypothetical protein
MRNDTTLSRYVQTDRCSYIKLHDITCKIFRKLIMLQNVLLLWTMLDFSSQFTLLSIYLFKYHQFINILATLRIQHIPWAVIQVI